MGNSETCAKCLMPIPRGEGRYLQPDSSVICVTCNDKAIERRKKAVNANNGSKERANGQWTPGRKL